MALACRDVQQPRFVLDDEDSATGHDPAAELPPDINVIDDLSASEVDIPAVTVEQFANFNSAVLDDEEIVYQVLEPPQVDSDSDDDAPPTPQSSSADLAQALTALFSTYSDGQTLSDIQADLIARKRASVHSGSSSKKKRRQFSLKEKVDILSQVDAGKKQIHIANEMGVAPSTVATILKDRQKILELHRGSQLAPSRKRLRLGNFEDVDAAVLIWFKDAQMVTGAWWSVTSTTIQNCWRKAGLVSESEQGSEESEASGMWQEVVERLAMDASVTFEDYVQCDDEACTSAELTTDDIVSAVRGDNSDEDANGEDDAETAPVSQPEESLSYADIVECVRKIRTYLGRCSNATEAEHKNVDNFEAFVLRQLSGTRQAKITDFFK
ncbi:hypothetical protein HPB49_008541 [Dermacentor silvarum]|uniref:Uncharacterized protein n=1 Tax=Dermacentor silvarum TaxID=543639 RepID=A0ACB8CE03_DERSI|nr:hypothetical protein HPB49_008541 [Dermacentor silvarum]